MTSSEAVPKSEDVRLACAFIPHEDKRAGVMALFALLETLREIPERVTEPMLGEIRLRWWYEAFEAIGQGRTPHYHPLVEALQPVIRQYGLPSQAFLDMIEGQMPLLEKVPLTVKTALDVVTKGEGIVVALAAQILGAEADMVAVARLHGLTVLKTHPGLSDAGDAELAHLVRDARATAKGLQVQLMPLALPAALAADIWRGRPAGPLRKRLKLTWSYLTGTI